MIENVPICNAKDFGILLKGNEKLMKISSRELKKSEQHFSNVPPVSSSSSSKDELEEGETEYRERNQVAFNES